MTSVPFRSKTSAAAVLSDVVGVASAPLSAMLELADRCNEVCVHCYQIQGQKGEMSTEQVFGLLDELASMGVLFLTLSGGEVTLRKDFLDIVRRARELQFAVKIFTNGLTMTENLARELGALAVQEVQISVYSPHAELHDKVTGVQGSWQKSVDGVRYLARLGVAVVIKTPVMSFNASDYPAYIKLAAELGADYMMDPGALHAREDGDRTPELFNAPPEAIAALKSELQGGGTARGLHANSRNPSTQQAQRDPNESVCGACQGVVHVEANGEVRPCSQWAVPCGNALEDGLAHAWSQSEPSQIVRGLTWGDLYGCRACDVSGYCGRCFAKARVSGADALAPYAEACSGALQRYAASEGRPVSVALKDGQTARIPERGARSSPTATAEEVMADSVELIGPFRREHDRLVQVALEMTDLERRRIHTHEWLQKERAGECAPQPSDAISQLVQIRLPRPSRPSRPSGLPAKGNSDAA